MQQNNANDDNELIFYVKSVFKMQKALGGDKYEKFSEIPEEELVQRKKLMAALLRLFADRTEYNLLSERFKNIEKSFEEV